MWSARAVRRILAGHTPNGVVRQTVYTNLSTLGYILPRLFISLLSLP